MQNLQYLPNSVTIDVGDTVVWENNGSESHSADGPGWTSPEIWPGESFSRTFDSAGSYDIECRFHPEMTMVVEVRDGGGESPEPTSPSTSSQTSTPTSSSSADSGSSGGGTDSDGGTVVGGGPLPAAFDLTDDNGSWFDTNVNLGPNVGQSLAVATLPRVNLSDAVELIPGVETEGLEPSLSSSTSTTTEDSLLGEGSIELDDGTIAPLLGAGMLPETSSTAALNADRPKAAEPMLNVDALREAIDKLVPQSDPQYARAHSLLDQFAEQASALPSDRPTSLNDLPVGVDLQDLLENLRDSGKNDIVLPVTANFTVAKPDAASSHTVTSLIWPDGAEGFPADQAGAWVGQQSMQLTEPGLYAFACKIHPYMLGAVVVDDPLTPGLDFGEDLRVASRDLNVASDSDIIYQLVQKFFTISIPSNWQKNSESEDTVWDPQYPPAPILVHDEEGDPLLIPSLDAFLKSKFNTPKVLPKLDKKPSVPGVGEVWIANQMEEYEEKSKHGSVTKIDASDWSIDRKVSLPEINMNNAHNMWTDKDEEVIYADEWFSNKTSVFDRETGEFIRSLEVGPSPSHVMTRTDTDQLHVAINGGGSVAEIAPGATRIDERIGVQQPGARIAHPHAQWMSGDGSITITPNVNTDNATIIDNKAGTIRHGPAGELPIATGMTPDSSKAYIADFLGASVSCLSVREEACVDGDSKVASKTIDLWANYDPASGATGAFGGLPIQIPVAPDNSAMLAANTLSSNVVVVDPDTDEVVKYLPCEAGCHGINFGAKKGGGYYAYVSSKFSNALSVIDTDPNGDGNPVDAAVVGKFVLDSTEKTAVDGTITAWDGFGGQGVLPVPLVYEGWVQRVPDNAVNRQLTCRQRNPVDYQAACQ